ncbi:MAG: hypothetical protein FD180_1392 [Planctomycetota bacterium]|nr:MAG: hypothetical protein FD180_1392 [Planctomycetota bacterium]
MMSMLRVLPLALCLALPVFSDDGKKEDPKKTEEPKKDEGSKTEPQDSDEVKKSVSEGIKKLEDKSYNFTAQIDVEMGGSPMLNTEMKGSHKKPYTKMEMDMMGQAIEIYTDGKSSVQKNPQSGAWEKTDNQMTGTIDPKQLEKLIKSATWDKKELKVGSHVCRVANAKVDKAKVAKLFAKSGMGGNAKISKSSLRIYLDKEDGKVRRMKLSMTMSMDMGGGGGGGGMELGLTMDQKLSYSSKVEVKIPEEVKNLLEGKVDENGGKEKDEEKDKEKDEESEEGDEK